MKRLSTPVSDITPDTASAGDLWVFGYGSLMWRPGFAFAERQTAFVRGYHRSLCVYSHVHRGTPDRPGLVMGLDRGGSCKGVVFRVAADRSRATILYLREREQVTSVYLERRLPVVLADGRQVLALAYTVDARHGQYAGKLERDTVLAFVRQGQGVSGANADYVLRTHQHLHEMGIDDPSLSWLARQLDVPQLDAPTAAAVNGSA